MKRNLIGLILGLGLIFAVSSDVLAQGRGRGGGGGNGRGNSGGQTVNRGNSGGINTNSSQNRRNDDRVNENRKNTGGQNNRYNGLSRKTGISSQKLRSWYESERALNPDLTYGQFVAANMIAGNHDGISAQEILSGLGNGRSIGQVLQDEGWSENQIKKERKRIKSKVKDDDDYQDRDRDWRF
jgi:hypothetical protein